MKNCFRVEIVVEKALARMMAEVLSQADAPGYTMIDHAMGRRLFFHP